MAKGDNGWRFCWVSRFCRDVAKVIWDGITVKIDKCVIRVVGSRVIRWCWINVN